MHATIQSYWPRSQYTLRAESNLVEVGVVVRGSRGRAVGGLSKEDFEIEDAGKKQEISSFSVETFTPISAPAPSPAAKPADAVPPNVNPPQPASRYVALLFDDLSMPRTHLVLVKTAARRFINGGLANGDRVGLFTTSGKQVVPFTSDVAKLAAAVEQYDSMPRNPFGGDCPKLTPYDAYVIANRIDWETFVVKSAESAGCSRGGGAPGSTRPAYTATKAWPFMGTNPLMMQADAMWAQVRDTSKRALESMQRILDYMAQLPGKRMILLSSSGFLVRTLEAEHQELVNHALRAEVVINSLDAKGLYAEDPPEMNRGSGPDSILLMLRRGTKDKDLSNDVMWILSSSTGGLFFENNNDLDLGMRELGMVPEVSYLLAFSPQEAPNGRYHDLKVRLRSRNDYIIQARPGYWAGKQKDAPVPERRVDREVMRSETVTELPALISSEPARTDKGNPAVEVVLKIDARKFRFVEKNGAYTQNLVFIATLSDESGAYVTGTELNVKFALKKPAFVRITETGLEMSVTLEAPPGTYRLRGVAQDGLDGKVIATSLPVQIR